MDFTTLGRLLGWVALIAICAVPQATQAGEASGAGLGEGAGGQAMILEPVKVGGMGNHAYVIGACEGGEGIIVDPSFEAEKILAVAKRLKLDITRILLTHHHFDHVNAAATVKARTGAKILAHAETGRLLNGDASLDGTVDDGELIKLGEGTVRIIHTPGHAPGGICLVVGDRWLVTGDTLFIGNCGRTDLPGGNPRKLFESLQRLRALPDALMVMPGHDYGPAPTRSLGEEKRLNPALATETFEAFDALP